MELDTVQWQVPKFETSPSTRVGWVEEQIEEGEGFLEGTYRRAINMAEDEAIYLGVTAL